MRAKLTAQMIIDMKEMYELGVHSDEIAKKLQLHLSTVVKKSKLLGFNRPPGYKKKPREPGLVKTMLRKQTTTPNIPKELSFKPYGDVGLRKSFELDCWHLLRLNEVAGVCTMHHGSE